MHLLFLGCNLWSALFLTAAAVLGLAGSSHHARVALFGAVFACLVQSGLIALFLGASKLAKEHVGRFGMPLSIIDRINVVYHRVVPLAAIGSLLAAVAAISGGVTGALALPVWPHAAVSLAAWAYLIAVIAPQYRLLTRMHQVLADVERLVPAPGAPDSPSAHPAWQPDRVVLDRAGRARALLYIGLTLPLPYLGYTYISGHDLSFLLVPTVLLTAACLGFSAHQYAAARRERDRHGA